jgi:hypothetical protein
MIWMTTSLEELGAFEEIRRLKARYSFFLDTKAWDEWRRLFTDDIHCDVEGVVTRGADDFVAWVRGRVGDAATVHQFHMPILEIVSPTTATGIWPMYDYLQFPETSDRPPFQGFGHYHETYRHEADGWRISHLQLTRLRIDNLSSLRPMVATSFAELPTTSAAAALLRDMPS